MLLFSANSSRQNALSCDHMGRISRTDEFPDVLWGTETEAGGHLLTVVAM
jgi:hypothetical protein